MLEKFGEALRSITRKIASAIFLDTKTIETVLKELRRALLEADVDVVIAEKLCEKIKQEALRNKRSEIEKREQLIKFLHDEIVALVGQGKELKLEKGKSQRIMFLGLYGCGKTTTIAKIALYYSKRGFKCCMLGLDVHRPAVQEQLEQLGKQIGIKTFVDKEERNPLIIWSKYEQEINKYDLCFIDTAGRHALDEELIKEIKKLGETIKPQHILLVLAADIGQAAKNQVAGFKKACNIDGVIITRMDGSAKGGGALAACAETSASVFFLGTGEHLNDIEKFSPTGFVSRLLGMGDIKALLEKFEITKEEKKEKGFTLLDFYEQLKTMQQAGPLDKIADMIPGISALRGTKALTEQEEKLKRWKYALDSMTPNELENPEILEKQTSRITRISRGSGVSTSEIRELLSQYKLLKNFASKQLDATAIASIQQGRLPAGLSQKQLLKLAKKYRKLL